MLDLNIDAILAGVRRAFRHELGEEMESLFVFGSRGRGDAQPDSDIDLLVVTRQEPDYRDMIARTSAIVSQLSLQHDVVISRAFVSRKRFDEEQSPFLLNVRRDAVIV